MSSHTVASRLACAIAAVTMCVTLASCGHANADAEPQSSQSATLTASPKPSASSSSRSMFGADELAKIRALDGNPDPAATRATFEHILFNGPSHTDTGKPGAWGDSGCDSTKRVRVISARGTFEQLGGGLLQPLAQQISDAFPGQVQLTSLDYAANSDTGSAADGVNKLVSMLNGQAEQCPAQASVLLGYSQGAMVVADALTEPSRRTNEDNGYALSSTASKNILAIDLFGEPRFNAKASYDVGDFSKQANGMMGARGLHELDAYASRMQSYCNATDMVCQTEGTSKGHSEYATNGLRDKAAQFAEEKIRAFLG